MGWTANNWNTALRRAGDRKAQGAVRPLGNLRRIPGRADKARP